MFARLAIIATVVGLCSLPCQAVAIAQSATEAQGPMALAAAETVATDILAPASFSLALPEIAPPRGVVERIFTRPNIAVMLAGFAWMALVRRRLGAMHDTSRR